MRKDEIEARLRGYAQDYEGQVPRPPDFERKVIARASAQRLADVRRPALIRDLALAGLVVVLIGSLGFGVMQLRSIRQASTLKSPVSSASPSLTPTMTPAPTLGPNLSYTPGLRVPVGPIEIGSAYTSTPFKMVTPLRGWAVGPPGKDRNQAHDAVLVTADGGAHWRNVTPPGFSGWTDRTMYFLDVTHAWVAVTPHVVAHPAATPATITVFRTADGGQSWQSGTFQIADGSPSQLDFIDAQRGWMVLQVDNGVAIYRTSDGGIRWEQAAVNHYTAPNGTALGALPLSHAFGPKAASQPNCEMDPFAALAFRDPSTGWAAGRCRGPAPSVYLYVTHDAGSTWQPQTLPSLDDMPTCPCTVGASAPVFTSSGDATFTVSIDTENSSCQSQNGGTACSIQPIPGTAKVYASHDGGNTWAPHVLPGVAPYVGGPTFIDARTGWYGSSILKAAPAFPGETAFDELYVTHDGGVSWSPLADATAFPGGAMQFVTPTTGWAYKFPSLLMTTDGGKSWQPLNAVVTG